MKPIPVPAGGFRNIAVLRLSSLGDVVLTLPVVRASSSVRSMNSRTRGKPEK